MDVPALNECWRTAPYLYDGRSYSMKDMLKVHGPHKPVTEKELEELEEYLLFRLIIQSFHCTCSH